MATLNNNQINTILNELYLEITGQEVSTPIPTKDFIDTGNDANTILKSQEQFTKALYNRLTKNIFTDAAYRSNINDRYFIDSEKYGAIVQLISIQAPEVQESHAWQEFTSGTSKAGEYTLYLPLVEVEIYGKTVSFELPIAVTGEQWDTAVTSESELATFINYVFLAVSNALEIHIEAMNMTNRNNFIAEKFAYAGGTDPEGIHIINLVQMYHDEVDSTVTTANEFRNNADALRYASKTLGLYMDYIRQPLSLFNTKGRVAFVPNDRFVCEILSDFKSSVDTVALSTTFNDKFVSLPNHYEVPFWQIPEATAGEALTFDSVSSINIKLSDTKTIEESGIVAFYCDKWAVMHTILSRRIASTFFDPENVTQYYHQFRDRFINNLGLSAIVFQLKDLVIPGP